MLYGRTSVKHELEQKRKWEEYRYSKCGVIKMCKRLVGLIGSLMKKF